MCRFFLWMVIGLCMLERPGFAQAPKQSGAETSSLSTDMNFDLLGELPKPDPASQKQALRIGEQTKLRRRLLLSHQALGFVALAALSATVIIGHLNYNDRYVSGDFTDRYQAAHIGLAATTTSLFALTGILALAAPNPYPKPTRLDTALVHKISMALATAGMATQVILGAITTAHVGRSDQANLALGHVVVGYSTWAFMTAGVVSYLF